jgi:uncharacterized protein
MEMTMSEKLIVPAGGGAGLRLEHGECLRVIDIEGGQTGDLVAFSADGTQRLCSGRTFDYGGKIYVSTGDVLWSNRSNPMLTIVADDVGKHDLLYSPCSLEMYRLSFLPPKTRAGASITLRAEMDLLIALSSCPAPTCNVGAPTKPLAFEIVTAA